jgi:hypothetical protein
MEVARIWRLSKGLEKKSNSVRLYEEWLEKCRLEEEKKKLEASRESMGLVAQVGLTELVG